MLLKILFHIYFKKLIKDYNEIGIKVYLACCNGIKTIDLAKKAT